MNNVTLFPIQQLAAVMREHGFDFPNARKAIAFSLSQKVGYEVKITPKFHECYNFVADVIKGRIRTAEREDTFRVCYSRDISIFETVAFSMEPAQVASFKALDGSPLALREALSQHMHACYPDKYPEPSVISDTMKELFVKMFNEVYEAWSVR